MGRRILITGGLGYIGGRIVEHLQASHSLVVSSRNKPNDTIVRFFTNVEFINHLDLLSPVTFPDNIDTIIHLAALNEIECLANPDQAILVNINHSRQILENAIYKKVKRFIFFSTIHVYGMNVEKNNIDELTIPRPLHPYAITHRAAEDYVLAANESGKIDGIVVRLSNSFGRPLFSFVNRWSLLINDICKHAIINKEIHLNSSGMQYRDFIALSDVVRAVELLVAIPVIKHHRVFNLTSGKSKTVLEMAEAVKDSYLRVTGISIPINLPEGSNKIKEKYFFIASNRFRDLGFEPFNNYERELDEMIRFCKIHFS